MLDEQASGLGSEPEGNPSLALPITLSLAAVGTSVAGLLVADTTAGWVRIAIGIASVVVGVLALYFLAILGLMLAAKWAGRVEHPRRETVLDHVPMVVWLVIPQLFGGWALWAWLAGFDRGQWFGTGAAMVVVMLALFAAHFRRRRVSVPDGPDGPRHRRRQPG